MSDVLTAMLAITLAGVGAMFILVPFVAPRNPLGASILVIAIGAALIALGYGAWLIR